MEIDDIKQNDKKKSLFQKTRKLNIFVILQDRLNVEALISAPKMKKNNQLEDRM